MTSKQQAIADEALTRATCGQSTANWGPIIQGFMDRGIPADEINPRVNVLTFHAWKALGRHVRKGEHGVKVTTWIPIDETKRERASREDAESRGETIKSRPHCRPRTATVFHISQTDADAKE